MAGKDRARVQTGYWLERARKAVNEVVDAVEHKTGAVTSARQMAARVGDSRDRAVERSAQTRTGQMAGAAMRSLGSLAARLPLTGLTTDAIAARHGLTVLASRLGEHPDDPLVGAQLVDALARADADRRRYRAVRTVVDPTSWVTRSATAAVGDVGRDRDPFADRLARSVYALALADLREDPADGRAWHALARVHLARGDAAGARQFAKLAALAEPAERALALVTLARAEVTAGLLPEADRFADLAVAAGQSVGWEVRSSAHERAAADDEPSAVRRARLDQVAQWRSMVRAEDRAAYFGVHVDAGDVAAALKDSQQRKVSRLADDARTLAESARPGPGVDGTPPPPPSLLVPPPPTTAPTSSSALPPLPPRSPLPPPPGVRS